MNINFLFNEIRDLKNEIRERKEDEVEIFYNQMLLAEAGNVTGLNHIITDRLENIDTERSTAEPSENGYTTLTGEEVVLITNDFDLTNTAGAFTIFSYKTHPNLIVKVEVSNEAQGEFYTEAMKQEERERDGMIEEIFHITKNPGNRIRLKFTMSKADGTVSDGDLSRFSVIYQY